MVNFKFREAVKWGLKIFAPNYQKVHPYAKSGRTNHLVYAARNKKYARIAIGNSISSITLQPLPRCRDAHSTVALVLPIFRTHYGVV